MRAVLAIDQGTTGTTCLVLDEHCSVIGRAYSEFTQHYPRPGWVEHDAAEIWDVTRASRAKRSTAHAGSTANLELAVSASRTSGRPSWCGTARRASPCTAPSSGRTGAPLHGAAS
jgi:glycerol kinase